MQNKRKYPFLTQKGFCFNFSGTSRQNNLIKNNNRKYSKKEKTKLVKSVDNRTLQLELTTPYAELAENLLKFKGILQGHGYILNIQNK